MSERPNTLRAVIDLYAAKRLRRTNPLTKRKFHYALNHWAMLIGREPTLDDLSDDSLADFQDRVISLHELTDETAVHYAKKIHALWRFAAAKRWAEFPEEELITPPERVPTAFTVAELRKLYRAFASQSGFIGGIPAGDWLTGFLSAIYDSTERMNAVLALQCADVNLETGWGIFRAEHRKNKRRDRPCLFHEETVAIFRRIWEPRRKLVFPFPHNRETLFNRWGAICESIGIPNDRYHKTTAVRKTTLSLFAAAGGDATGLADHSSPSVTKRHYLDPRLCEGPQASRLIPRPNDDDGPRTS